MSASDEGLVEAQAKAPPRPGRSWTIAVRAHVVPLVARLMALLAWGALRFEAGATSYERLAQRFRARWERHPIIGRRPAGQFLGPDDEGIVLRGTVYPGVIGAKDPIEAARDDARSGTVNLLITGSGDVLGPHRLEQIEIVETHLKEDGDPQKADYELIFFAHDDGDGQVWGFWP